MKQGSFAWAMTQLLAGKKVAREGWGDKNVYFILDPSGSPKDSHNRTANFTNLGLNADDWIIWHPPINYPVGTFPWAVEQMKQGKVVRYDYHKLRLSDNNIQRFDIVQDTWYNYRVKSEQILATNWEVI